MQGQMPALNRHTMGISALLAILATLGVVGTGEPPRRIAALNNAAQITDNQGAPWMRLLSERTRQAQEPTPSSELAGNKNARPWSSEEWNIAAQAVREHRSATKHQPIDGQKTGVPAEEQRSSGEVPLVWEPPAEIAH